MPKRTMKCYRYAEKCVDEKTLVEYYQSMVFRYSSIKGFE